MDDARIQHLGHSNPFLVASSTVHEVLLSGLDFRSGFWTIPGNFRWPWDRLGIQELSKPPEGSRVVMLKILIAPSTGGLKQEPHMIS